MKNTPHGSHSVSCVEPSIMAQAPCLCPAGPSPLTFLTKWSWRGITRSFTQRAYTMTDPITIHVEPAINIVLASLCAHCHSPWVQTGFSPFLDHQQWHTPLKPMFSTCNHCKLNPGLHSHLYDPTHHAIKANFMTHMTN